MKEKETSAEKKSTVSEKTQKRFIQKVNEFNVNNVKFAILLIFGVVLFSVFFIYGDLFISSFNAEKLSNFFDAKMFLYISIGFIAQAIDGSLGMAYGATSNSLLLGMGISPVVSSASIHFAEVFTTGASGISHLHFGNVNKKLLSMLVLPGVLGAVFGAYFISNIVDTHFLTPYISFYVLILGILFLRKALKRKIKKRKTKYISVLAVFGGFLDSMGGGGWGPIVTSTLVNRGRNIVYTIGSVNVAEFFVAFASSFTFLFFLQLNDWKVIVGLIIGGIFAAPFAAIIVRKIEHKKLMLIVGIFIVVLSCINFITAISK